MQGLRVFVVYAGEVGLRMENLAVWHAWRLMRGVFGGEIELTAVGVGMRLESQVFQWLPYITYGSRELLKFADQRLFCACN